MRDEKSYPSGSELKSQIYQRHRRGTLWRTLFLASTIVGILALAALVYNIVNEAFGLTAVVSTIEPTKLVRDEMESTLLNLSNTVSSEDDHELVQAIANDPNGIGFIGFAFYQENAESLKLLSVDGVTPNLETAASGEYPITRPLYLYTSANVLQSNQAATVFVNYYLSHVNEEIEAVGYFPADWTTFTQAQIAYNSAADLGLQPGQWAVINPDGIAGAVHIAGSSTVFPLTQQIGARVVQDGFAGEISLSSIGTTAGFRAFCLDGTVDIVNASRKIQPGERNACRENGRTPLELRIGTDALAVVVNKNNTFLENATKAELQQLFSTADTWAEVNPSWPDAPIQRYVPGQDSGTLDFFVDTIFDIELADLPKDTLVKILAAYISTGRGRALEREQKFYADKLVFESPKIWNEVCAQEDRPEGCTDRPRNEENIYGLILRDVVELDVLETWSLVDSIFNRSAIETVVVSKYPDAALEFRSWLTPSFVVSPQSSTPEFAGVRTAILGTLWVVVITIAFSFPVGVGAAIYLEEYAEDNRLNRLIQTNINNLAGVPSIIYGLLGLTVFVRVLEVFTSGRFFGAVQDVSTANGRTILSAGLTLGLLILPVVIIASQEAIRAVPNSMRQAGMALGATKWQTIWAHVLPSALPGILTGTILAIARAVGETAPLVVVGASTFIVVDPISPFSKFTVLPIQIFQWTSRPQAEFRNIAAAAIIVLLVLLLTLNTTAVLLRNRFSRRA